MQIIVNCSIVQQPSLWLPTSSWPFLAIYKQIVRDDSGPSKS